MIDRRTLLAGMGAVLLATPLAAEAQQLLLDRPTPLLVSADEIYQLALQRKLPTAAATRAFVNAGCLMSYGEKSWPDVPSRRSVC